MSTTRCPTHPGEILREDGLPALGLSVSATASPIWRGDGVVSQLSEKDFPSEAEFLRAEARRGDLEFEAARAADPNPLKF